MLIPIPMPILMPISTNANTDQYQYRPIPMLTNTNTDQWQYRSIPISTNANTGVIIIGRSNSRRPKQPKDIIGCYDDFSGPMYDSLCFTIV